MAARAIYVERRIEAPVGEVWRRTQEPSLHRRWDLRFTRIEYLPRPDPAAPQRFLYETRVGFGLGVRGEGESTGERDGADGARSSALRFWSDERRSLIREGSGYWRYVPDGRATRFLTRYDYATRFGAAGRLVDRLAFRPLLGWATAWSFDRLALWIERGLAPEAALRLALAQAAARAGLALCWLYQGLVPKLLVRDPGELALLRGSGLAPGGEALALALLGAAELLLGLLHLVLARLRPLLLLDLALLALLAAGALAARPRVFVEPFNPASLSLAMAALALAGLAAGSELPSARRCRRAPPGGEGA